MALGPQETEDPGTGRGPSTCAIKSSSKALLEFSCEIVRERTFMIHTAREVAQYLGVELEGDPAAPISGVASPERASQEDLNYVDSWRHLGRAAASRALCLLVQPEMNISGKTGLSPTTPS